MKLIGITGGVGAGKSEVLRYLQETYRARVVLADDIANQLKQPGMSCYQPVIDCLGSGILNDDGTIDKAKMAAAIFSDQEKLDAINKIIHPAVREYIVAEIQRERQKNEIPFFVFEAALLIEEHYDELMDEMWYVFAKDDIRRERLKQSRGYSDEKITSIMQKQLGREEFEKACTFVLDNSGSFEETKKQIDEKMGVYLCRNQK